MGNCVGHYNYKYFVCFLFWTSLTCGQSAWLIMQRVFAMVGGAVVSAGNAAGVAVATVAPINGPGLTVLDGVALWLFAVLNFLVLLMVTCLLGFHIRMITRNMTTIESMEEQSMHYASHRARPRVAMPAFPGKQASADGTPGAQSPSSDLSGAFPAAPQLRIDSAYALSDTTKAGGSGTPPAPAPPTSNEHRYDLGAYRNIVEVLGPHPLLWLLPIGNSKGDGHAFATRAELG